MNRSRLNIRSLFFILALLVTPVATHAQDGANIFVDEQAERAAPAPDKVTDTARAQAGPESKRHRVIVFDATAILSGSETLMLNFFDDGLFVIKEEKVERIRGGKVVHWEGMIQEDANEPSALSGISAEKLGIAQEALDKATFSVRLTVVEWNRSKATGSVMPSYERDTEGYIVSADNHEAREKLVKEYSEGFDIFHVIGGTVTKPGTSKMFYVGSLNDDPRYHVISEYDTLDRKEPIDDSIDDLANDELHQLYVESEEARQRGDEKRAEAILVKMKAIVAARES